MRSTSNPHHDALLCLTSNHLSTLFVPTIFSTICSLRLSVSREKPRFITLIPVLSLHIFGVLFLVFSENHHDVRSIRSTQPIGAERL